MKKPIFFLFFIALSPFLFAQTFEISGQLRPRFEYRHGYKSLIGDDQKAGIATSQRTRINLNYSTNIFKTYVSLQDIRVWGDVVTSNKSDLNGTMVHQAWGELFVVPELSFKVGRQCFIYDDQRLFGGNDWVQQARSHDALLIKYAPLPKLQLHVGLAFNQASDNLTGHDYNMNHYKSLQFFWGHYDFGKIGISLVAVNNGLAYNTIKNFKHVQETNYTQTFGPYITINTGSAKINLAGYYQIGTDSTNKDVSAGFASGEFSYNTKMIYIKDQSLLKKTYS